MLALQMEKGRRELEYLNSVLENISLAEGERDLQEIRQELAETGRFAVDPALRAALAKDFAAYYLDEDETRAAIRSLYGARVARSVTIQYGGSMNAANAEELLAKYHVDGGLIGGASLKAQDFATIVRVASK